MRKQHRMNRMSRPGRRALAVAGVSLLALTAAACSSSSSTSAGSSSTSSGTSPVTITEFDYYTSSGGNAALNWYNAQFMKAHPNITVKRTSVPYPNLITKILQDASAGDMPNLMLIDNPDVPEVAATGQLVPLDNMPGFTTSGYTAGAIAECTYQGKHYCYPIGTNTVGLFYNKSMFAAAHLSPPRHLGAAAG
jgi:multiple sugar transport system substrate-binding protein